MKTLEIRNISKPSLIYVGESLLHVSKYIAGRKTIIITDSNILKLYKDSFLPGIPVIEIGLGEKNKTIGTIHYIMEQLVKNEADRSTFLLAVGGGIVCDMAGFAASIYMRGIPFGFVSTTLLSQVDASVGGKNGVNHEGYKNMIGVFNQPEFVICDNRMLATLDKEDFRSGFAEIIKAGAIKNSELFWYCDEHAKQAMDNDDDTIIHMVYESLKIKAAVVEADEREQGERRLLNFGHTFAHAIEKMKSTSHGKAVSIGMALASKVSYKLGMINEKEKDAIIDVIHKYGLPVEPDIPVDRLFDSMKKDKKREGDFIHLVLLEKIGCAVSRKISFSELQKLVYDLRSNF